jgi:Fe(3+) dicitrate transport protein
MSRMTQVRVVKGPGAIAYGPQTIGGAIDLISRPIPSDEGGQIDVTVGEYAYGKVQGHVGARTDRLGFLVEGVHLRTDGFKELPGGEDTGFYRNEWVAKATYDLAPTSPMPHELSFKGMFSNELSNESYLGLTDADFRANPHQRYAASKLDQMRWYRTAFAFTHRIEPVRRLKIESTVYRNDLSRVWRKTNAFQGAALYDVLSRPDDPSNAIFVALLRGEIDSSSAAETLLIGPNSRDFVSEGIQTRVNYETTTGPVTHRLEYGLRLHHDRVERKHTEDGFSMVGGDVVPAGTPTRTTAWNEAWTEAVAFHVVNAMTLGGLTVTPGARIELMRSALVDRQAVTEQRGSARAFC